MFDLRYHALMPCCHVPSRIAPILEYSQHLAVFNAGTLILYPIFGWGQHNDSIRFQDPAKAKAVAMKAHKAFKKLENATEDGMKLVKG